MRSRAAGTPALLSASKQRLLKEQAQYFTVDGLVDDVLEAQLAHVPGEAAGFGISDGQGREGALGVLRRERQSESEASRRHQEPRRARPFSQVVCVVRVDAFGFDPETVEMRIGLKESITSRIESVGGRVEIASKPGRGTEVRLWAP